MPAKEGSDKKGLFIRWGKSGKKYYYVKGNKASKAAAWKKATAQGAAIKASGFKENKMLLQRIVANFNGMIRHDEMEGRKYIVAPMIMLTEGVHEGSDGPLLYPKEELSMTPQVWNHKPVVVYHPSRNGEGVSACDPIILTNRKVGVIMNTKFEDGKLKAEAWMEPDRIDAVDERILEFVEKNQMMELSTGLFTSNESVDGEWNGEKYSAIARNYRPDHLALLPDLKGACSIEDGAGFLRVNADVSKIKIVNNEMSHGNVRSLLNSWLQNKDEDAWTEDVYDTFFVFLKDGKLFKGNYSLKNNSLEVENSFIEVVRVTEYRTTNGEFVGNKDNANKRKENQMDKKKVVDALIKSDSNSWIEDNRELLMNMEEIVLTTLESSDQVACQMAVDVAATAVAKAKATVPVTVVDNKPADKPAENKQQTTEEYIDKAPSEVAAVLKNSMNVYNSMKDRIVKSILSNEKNQFTEAQLKAKSVDELRRIAAFAVNVESESLDLTFEGQFSTPANPVENKETAMPMPAVLTAKS